MVLECTQAYVGYYDMFLVVQWTLNDDLSKIESVELLSSVPAGDVMEYGINGEYGFMVACVARSKDENETAVKHYAFFATDNGGKNWVMYDPQTPGTPEISLERTFLFLGSDN